MTAYDEEKYHDSERSDSADQSADSHTGDDHSDDQSNGHAQSNKQGLDTGSIILIVLVVLAIIASIVMLIASSTAALKIALLAALWAAVGGIFLVSRYRNQVRDREDELYVREDLYHAELERLRAQQETRQAIEHLENSSSVDMDVLAEIKAELASIREQLEELSGREFTYEPAALQAEARRIMEIEARAHAAEANGNGAGAAAGTGTGSNYNSSSYASSYGTDFGDDAEPEFTPVNYTQAPAGKPSADAIAGRIGNTPTYPRNDNPLAEFINEMNSNAKDEEPKPAAAAKAPAESVAEPVAEPAAEKNAPKAETKKDAKKKSKSKASEAAAKAEPKPEAKPEKKAESKVEDKAENKAAAKAEDSQGEKPKEFNTGSFQAVRWDAGGDEAAKPAAKNATPAEEEDEPRGGRRRSDAHRQGSVSVAELLAAAKKREKDS
ncbi:DUF6779 domain-containing protein [Corynebacterium casei]|uniref:DUF6779 domain-containing protein n=1 Tax=Corynebacterium casei TaxID=160386 RepID=UPI003F922EC1